MNIKIYLYILVIPICIWVMTSLNIEKYFKKGSINQIKVFYLIISLVLSYLLVNFLYEFYEVSQIIK